MVQGLCRRVLEQERRLLCGGGGGGHKLAHRPVLFRLRR